MLPNFFLPGRAKDLSAPRLHAQSTLTIKDFEFSENSVMCVIFTTNCKCFLNLINSLVFLLLQSVFTATCKQNFTYVRLS